MSHKNHAEDPVRIVSAGPRTGKFFVMNEGGDRLNSPAKYRACLLWCYDHGCAPVASFKTNRVIARFAKLIEGSHDRVKAMRAFGVMSARKPSRRKAPARVARSRPPRTSDRSRFNTSGLDVALHLDGLRRHGT